MIFERQTIEALERLQTSPWEGTVFRHMLAEFEPDRENVKGARWNPPECPAIYTSLERKTCIAEADYHLGLQPVPITVKRSVYRIKVVLQNVLNMSQWTILKQLGVTREDFAGTEFETQQEIGGAAEWLKHDGILVPSARASGANLVIFPRQQTPEYYQFLVLDREVL
jgi:RES domain-containing protein